MDVVRFADCELRIPTRELWRQGQRQPLRKRVFDLLAYLIRRRPATASHTEIAKSVWGRSDVQPSVIAQAVLHARRAIGDDLQEPTLILSVRGVGYRFDAVSQVGVATAVDAVRDDDVAKVRAAVDEAQHAAQVHDYGVALYLSENAIALAQQIGANALQARAMAIASWAALHKGTLPLALSYALKALRLAEAEEHRAITALARVRAAHVLHVAGDLQGAFKMLHAVRIPGDVPADDPVALHCESLAGRVCGDLLLFEDAAGWLARACRTALRLYPARRGVRERGFLVKLHLQEADAAEAAGDPARARAAYEQAFAANQALAQDCAEVGDAEDRVCWYGNQAIALCGLGQVDEAWGFAEAAAQTLATWPSKGSPWYLAHQGELAIQWAEMLHKTGRNREAIERVQALGAEAHAGGSLEQSARMAALASKASEALGDFKQALAWTRRAQQAQHKLGLERQTQLACAYQASHNHDQLMQELQASQAALQSAQAQLRQLQGQLANAPLRDAASAFLEGRDVFEQLLRQRFLDAKARDLPCLVGLLHLDPVGPATAWDTPAGRQSVLLASAVRIRLHLGAAGTRVCAWSEHALAFTIEGVGQRRGLQVCAELQSQLNGTDSHPLTRPPGLRFRLQLCDLGMHDSFPAAWLSLEPPPVVRQQRTG